MADGFLRGYGNDKNKDYRNNTYQSQNHKKDIEAGIRLFRYLIQMIRGLCDFFILCHFAASLYDRAVFVQFFHNGIRHQNRDTACH